MAQVENIFPDLEKTLSIVHGPTDIPLVSLTLGQLIEQQSRTFHDRPCIVCPETGARWTFGRLNHESVCLAKAMIALGIKVGDRVAVMAGNCEQYASIFFAAARTGAILVVVNNTYTSDELKYALSYTECKLLFIVPTIGRQANTNFLYEFGPRPKDRQASRHLEDIVLIQEDRMSFMSGAFLTYNDLTAVGSKIPGDALSTLETLISPYDVCNLQFTSGSTGNPKAAMLTHYNLINNARFIGSRLVLTPSDILCCPPPLFHCFGLVLGLLTTFCAGASIIYPSSVFSPSAVLSVLATEPCTALHGVPAMFDSILNYSPRPQNFSCPTLRTGIIAGSPVPRPLMRRLFDELGMREFTSSYGLTETSPTVFNALTSDSLSRRLTTVGRAMPHTHAKIVDRNGAIVPRGTRGELCIAGYALQRGYWRNPEKTAETMKTDEDGILWLHTGDEAVFDEHDYATITGRFKDIIIRGGENIYPLEIEDRLITHGAIAGAAVVGIRDDRYGEVVGAFLKPSKGIPATKLPSLQQLQAFTRQKLGWHKAPVHVFWLGNREVMIHEFPTTGSGKLQKHKLRSLGDRIVALRARGKSTVEERSRL